MTRNLASLLATAALACVPAVFAAEHGGAIPNNFSFYDSSEFADVQWAEGRDGSPAWGSVVLEGGTGVRFVPDNGAEVKIPYGQIKAIKYELVVKEKEKSANQKWFKKPLAFAKIVETYRTVTLEHSSGDGRSISKMRVDEETAKGMIRVLETRTGLRAKRLSAL